MATASTPHLRGTFSVAALCLLLTSQSVASHEYSSLIRAKKYEEVERLASSRLAAEPNQADALVGRVEAIVTQGLEHRFDEAVKLAEQCIAAHPQKSGCHEALGNALGTKAMTAGILSAMGYAGKIRDAFKKAVELDPQNLDARFSLLQYYLQAPGIVGGGKGNAQELVTQTAKVSADAAKLMQAQLDLADDAFAKAEAAALSIQAPGSLTLQDAQRDLLIGLGTKYVQDKKYADGQRVFQEVARRFPDSEWGPYGMARTLQEQGRNKDAITLFEKALAIEPRAHIHYRMAQCWQALSDKSKALAAFEKSLDFKPGLGKKQRADAQEQLKALRG
ncbi:tetratricopeptide repeat protein [Rhodoferax sp.]|uniref:tetratricopeptide repeat protein n=1 Tax=Rhodoferax sp. TaxID=50421 RepID=UPI00274B7B79|nr:tetratricopeptide repeat protein [Rhodoferax sp.]